MAGVEPIVAVNALLEQHPCAVVAAVGAGGLLIALPPAVRLHGQRVLTGRSLVEWVVAEDRAAVAQAWFQARSEGRAQAPVRLLSDPDSWVLLHLLRCAEAALVMAVVVPEDLDGAPVQLGQPLRSTTRASYRQDDAGVIVSCDERSAAMLGFRSEELVDHQGLDLVHPEDQAPVIDAWLEAMATARPCTARYRHACAGGAWMWVDGTIHHLRDEPAGDCVLVELIDVSEAMAAKQALEARETLLNRLTQALPVGVFQVDADERILFSNERLHTILGTAPGADLGSVLVTVEKADQERLRAMLRAGLDGDLEVGLRRPDGRPGRALLSIRSLSTASDACGGAIVCVSDTTESVRMRTELEDRATFDSLTRCHNRASIMAAVDAALAGRATAGVLFLDLDRFKAVNDLLGHAVGDELLLAVAGRLRGCLRDGDLLGRIGGDEFLVLCRAAGPAELLLVADRVSAALRQEIRVAQHVLTSSASIGAACSRPGMTADELVAMADDAMYRSKRQGTGSAVLSAGPLPSPGPSLPARKV